MYTKSQCLFKPIIIVYLKVFIKYKTKSEIPLKLQELFKLSLWSSSPNLKILQSQISKFFKPKFKCLKILLFKFRRFQHYLRSNWRFEDSSNTSLNVPSLSKTHVKSIKNYLKHFQYKIKHSNPSYQCYFLLYTRLGGLDRGFTKIYEWKFFNLTLNFLEGKIMYMKFYMSNGTISISHFFFT